jgi:hypothetical protein
MHLRTTLGGGGAFVRLGWGLPAKTPNCNASYTLRPSIQCGVGAVHFGYGPSRWGGRAVVVTQQRLSCAGGNLPNLKFGEGGLAVMTLINTPFLPLVHALPVPPNRLQLASQHPFSIYVYHTAELVASLVTGGPCPVHLFSRLGGVACC